MVKKKEPFREMWLELRKKIKDIANFPTMSGVAAQRIYIMMCELESNHEIYDIP